MDNFYIFEKISYKSLLSIAHKDTTYNVISLSEMIISHRVCLCIFVIFFMNSRFTCPEYSLSMFVLFVILR